MKRIFVSGSLPESLNVSIFFPKTFASLPGDKSATIATKIGGILIFLTLMISCANPAKDTSENAPGEGRLAAQLWTFRYDLEKDVPGTLQKIKKLGIDYVEGFDAPYIVDDPDKFKGQLDAAGLKMFALHWSDMNDWRKDPTVIIETAKKLGAHYTGIAWLKVSKADTVTLDVVNEAADILTKSCPQAQAAGLQPGYQAQTPPMGRLETDGD